jgi:hypothetical protein
VTTEQDGTSELAATPGSADEERAAAADEDDEDDDAQPAIAGSAAITATSDRVRTASRTDARWSAFSAA